jgi:hypothetical protein
LPLHVGLDFNIDPMSAHLYQEEVQPMPDGSRRVVSYQIDEIHITSSNTHEIASEIKTRYGKETEQSSQDVRHITIYPDPAGAGRRTSAHGETDITILRKQGFHVYAMSSHPLVRDRINIVNGKYCSADGFRALYIAPNCKRSLEAVEKHQYKEGTSEPEKGAHDHDNDATGYYIYTRFAFQKTRPENIPIMGR